MSPLTFGVLGRARPQGSKRAVGPGRMIEQSKHVGPWRDQVAGAAHLAAREAHWPLSYRGPVEVRITVLFARPASSQAPFPGQPYGDVDKLARSLLDALSGRSGRAASTRGPRGARLAPVIADDTQVVELHATKGYGSRDEVVITVTPVLPHHPQKHGHQEPLAVDTTPST
jgi:crossover junction endodeoxyribonuclease RusA